MSEQRTPSNLLPLASDLVPPPAAAQFLRTTEGTLAVWRCRKRYPLKFVRVGRRIFYRLRDLEAFLEARTETGVTEETLKRRPRANPHKHVPAATGAMEGASPLASILEPEASSVDTEGACDPRR